MYVPMKNILDHANQEYYAVLAVNCFNMEMARAAIMAAEEENSPIIISIGQGQMAKHADGELMCSIIKKLCEKVRIPVALNLDHGKDYDKAVAVIKKGFSSIMIDASVYEFDENVRRTKAVVDIAKPLGITVEGELGHVGNGCDYGEYDNSVKKLFTDPSEAKIFVEKTGVDALAVAIGTAHGAYKEIPKIDFERLKEIKQTLKMPLVLHGGSGSGDENIRKSIGYGINKVNICTDVANEYRDAFKRELEENPNIDPIELLALAEKKVKEKIRYYLHLFGSINQGDKVINYICKR